MEEIRYGDESYLSDIAFHFANGGMPNKAYEYFVDVAELAKRVYAYEDAVEIYKKAEKLSIEYDKKERIYSELGAVYEIIGEYENAISYLKKAHKIANNKGDRKKMAEYLERIGSIFDQIGEVDKVKEIYEKALDLIDENNALASKLYPNIAWLYLRRSRFEDAIKYANQGAEIVVSNHYKKEEADTYHVLGTIYTNMRVFDKAEEYLKRAMKIREEKNDLYGLSTEHNNLGALYDNMGRLDDALSEYKSALEIPEKIGYIYQSKAIVLTNIGNIYAKRGNLQKAVEYYLMNLSISEKVGDWFAMMLVYMNIGTVYAMGGVLGESQWYFKKALKIATKQDERESIADIYKSLGNIHYFRGELDSALEKYNKTMEIYEQIDSPIGIGETQRDLAMLYFSQGNRKEAIKIIEESFKTLEENNCIECLFESHIAIVEMKIEMAEYEVSIKHAQQALQIATDEKSKIMMINSLRLMGKAYGFKDEIEKGIDYLNDALEISKTVDSKKYYALCLKDLGSVKLIHSHSDGEKLLKEAQDIFKKLGFEIYTENIAETLGQ